MDDADPDRTCEFESAGAPNDWASDSYDDGSWAVATEWSATAVRPKDGYDEIS